MKIVDIDSLRKHAIDCLEKLSSGKISTEEAGVTGKLCENIVSTVKVQLEYAKMLDQQPNIDFLENNTLPTGRILEHAKQEVKLLNSDKKK